MMLCTAILADFFLFEVAIVKLPLPLLAFETGSMLLTKMHAIIEAMSAWHDYKMNKKQTSIAIQLDTERKKIIEKNVKTIIEILPLRGHDESSKRNFCELVK